MLHAQGGVCAICNRLSKNGKRLVVDHCHRTKVVRGLLCHNCNLTLGKYEDNPQWLIRMVDYLHANS